MPTRKQLKVLQKKQRLDKFLQAAFPKISRTELQNVIASGTVLVDGVVAQDKSKTVKLGQKIGFTYQPPSLIPTPDVKLNKLYEDSNILVIDKPPGLVVHPNPREQKPSVASAVLSENNTVSSVGEDKFRPGIVHRIDIDTSGVLIIAKNQKTYEYLKQEFQSRNVYKEYLVLVHGQLKDTHGKIEVPIGRQAGHAKLSAGLGRKALTEYWVKEKFGSGVDIYSYLRVQLHTGRTHQIRVHFSYLGCPVAGDKLYGGKWKKVDSKRFSRQFLHAHKLRIKFASGAEKEFVSPLPADLRQALNKLHKL